MGMREGQSMDIGTIRPININEEMRGSYLDYAMSVIVARALPDARDGLKPVHRRILFAMYDMGIRSGTAYKKSARIVGEVLGKYHPHGDASVYDAMARMAQDFSLRYPLIDGQGNFGSVDGDSPAAMRYTEARLDKLSEELLTDINMDTVNFTDNYDGTQQEPVVLPARLPNLLLNGSNGIAVGMATNIPPHNLHELANAIAYMIDRYDQLEEITVDDLMQYVHGPDFPTGGIIIVSDELKEAYATGRGRVVVRAHAEIEEVRGGDRHRIVFTSIPYQISKTLIIERIIALVREGRLDEVSDLRDESDRDGLRLVVELKRGAQPKKVLNKLYKYSQLQSTFSIQMLALVNGEPRNLSLKRCLQIYIDHRFEVITRRTQFELGKRRERAHILSGLLRAISNLDEIINVIRKAADSDAARTELMARFEFSQAQAEAILEMQLRRLAALESQKLQDEYDQVMQRIAYLEDLLATPAKILALIREDVLGLAQDYGDKRNTEVIQGVRVDFNEADFVREEEVVISLSVRSYIKRVPSAEYKAQRRGGKGVRGMATKDEDALLDIFSASTLDTILLFSNKGRVYSEKAYNIPEGSRSQKGTPIHALMNVEPDEFITAALSVTSFEDGAHFVLATKHGRIKRVQMEEFADVRPSGLIAMNLDEDDILGWVKMTDGDQDIVLATENGQSIRFHESEVRVMGRQAGGVSSIRLGDGDVVAGMDVVTEEDTHVLVVTRNGYGKRTLLSEYRGQGRFGRGIRTIKNNEKSGKVVAMRCMKDDDDIVMMSKNGLVLRAELAQVRETGRSAMGVRLIHLSRQDEVVGIAVVARSEDTTAEMSAIDGDMVLDGELIGDGSSMDEDGYIDDNETPLGAESEMDDVLNDEDDEDSA
jgi:DNA gyrase subunit A